MKSFQVETTGPFAKNKAFMHSIQNHKTVGLSKFEIYRLIIGVHSRYRSPGDKELKQLNQVLNATKVRRVTRLGTSFSLKLGQDISYEIAQSNDVSTERG